MADALCPCGSPELVMVELVGDEGVADNPLARVREREATTVLTLLDGMLATRPGDAADGDEVAERFGYCPCCEHQAELEYDYDAAAERLRVEFGGRPALLYPLARGEGPVDDVSYRLARELELLGWDTAAPRPLSRLESVRLTVRPLFPDGTGPRYTDELLTDGVGAPWRDAAEFALLDTPSGALLEDLYRDSLARGLSGTLPPDHFLSMLTVVAPVVGASWVCVVRRYRVPRLEDEADAVGSVLRQLWHLPSIDPVVVAAAIGAQLRAQSY